MIVKMKKVTLLVSVKQREEALKRLRRLGVLHVKAVRSPQSEDINRLMAEAARTEKASSLLPADIADARSEYSEKVSQTVSRILELANKRESAAAQLAERRGIREWFRKWGDFSYSTVRTLSGAGVFIRLYVADKGTLKNLPEDKHVVVLGKSGGSFQIALFAFSPEDKLDLREEIIPPVEAAGLEKDIRGLESELASVDSDLAKLSCEKHSLATHRNQLKKQLEFASALSGMGVEGRFVYIQGFCPREAVQNLKNIAEQESWGYLIEEPDDPTEVPTLIRNPKWIRIIAPLIRFMGTVPGYEEKDISLWFLLFFTLFFAMLIGDAGYGLIFLGLTYIAQKKTGKNAPQEFFHLLYVVSTATLIWGAASGTWFGVPQIAGLPFLRRLTVKQLNGSAGDNSAFMMYLCFIIGVVQLSLAHVISALKTINSPRALAEVGWIGILWSVFFLAGNLVLGRTIPPFAGMMFLVGVVMTLLFSNFQKNIFRGILATLSSLPFSILGSFSDTVSYLRLYAVGIAGVTVSASFNGMLLGSADNILTGALAVVLLFLAHALNIALGCMSVLVHGVRLNMLEFSGHLGMSWTGKQYEPFKE